YYHTTNTQGIGEAVTHTNTQHNTHNATSEAEAPPRHRHTRHHQRQQIGKHNTTRHPTEGQGQLKNFQERSWTVNLTHFLGFPKGVANFIFSEFPKGAPPSTQQSHYPVTLA